MALLGSLCHFLTPSFLAFFRLPTSIPPNVRACKTGVTTVCCSAWQPSILPFPSLPLTLVGLCQRCIQILPTPTTLFIVSAFIYLDFTHAASPFSPYLAHLARYTKPALHTPCHFLHAVSFSPLFSRRHHSTVYSAVLPFLPLILARFIWRGAL